MASPKKKYGGPSNSHSNKSDRLRPRDSNYPREGIRRVLGQYLFDNLSLDISQPEIAALVTEGELFVIETE